MSNELIAKRDGPKGARGRRIQSSLGVVVLVSGLALFACWILLLLWTVFSAAEWLWFKL
jgi:hypothetical protein